MVAAWLQRQIHIRIACFLTGFTQGMNLSVCPTRLPVPAATDNVSLRNDDTSHIGIGVRTVNPLPGQTDGLRHVLPLVQRLLAIVVIRQQRHLVTPLLGRWFLFETLDFITKFADVLKTPVHGSKAHVGDLVQIA